MTIEFTCDQDSDQTHGEPSSSARRTMRSENSATACEPLARSRARCWFHLASSSRDVIAGRIMLERCVQRRRAASMSAAWFMRLPIATSPLIRHAGNPWLGDSILIHRVQQQQRHV
jgi:hypothetical protein